MRKPKIIPICSPVPKVAPWLDIVAIIGFGLVGASIAIGIAACMVWAFSEGWKHV